MLEPTSRASGGLAATPSPDPAYRSAATLLLVGDPTGASDAAEEAASLAGARVVARLDSRRLEELLPALPSFDAMLVEAGSADAEELDRLLHWTQALAARFDARQVICCSDRQLDQVVVQASAPDVQLLCNADLAEMVTAIAIAARPPAVAFGKRAHEDESERLRRLGDEVARIAEALTHLTRADAERRSGGTERSGYAPPPRHGHAPEPGQLPLADGADEPLPQPSAVRAVIRARRLRAQFFDPQLFADPAWDMLLDLTAARLERASVSVSSLCIAAAVPPTTALRWISTMTEAGLFEREDDPLDRRRAYVALTERAFAGMRGYIAAVRRMGLPVF